jgi:nucleolin
VNKKKQASSSSETSSSDEDDKKKSTNNKTTGQKSTNSTPAVQKSTTPAANSTKKGKNQSSSSETSSSDEDDGKKRKQGKQQNGQAAMEEMNNSSFNQTPAGKFAENGNGPSSDGKQQDRFRRVTIDKNQLPSNLQDNSFHTKHDPWGEKAHRDLAGVTGKNFRHEKTKKKRGSYRGGEINTQVQSIKFDD